MTDLNNLVDLTKLAPRGVTTCPKCHFTSGDDWKQCGGQCPMPGSPHYDGSLELKVKYGSR
jgi:hypothetical protein